MGVIQKQSINYTLVHLAGVLIGTISTILIYPLNREAYGLARFLIDFSIFLYPFVLLGYENVAIRYFPQFKNNTKGHGGFLGFLLLSVLAGCAVLGVVSFLWGAQILAWLEFHTGMQFAGTPLIEQFIWLTIPIICFMGISWLFNQYLSNFHKILFPAILQNLIKISLPILVLLYHYKKAGIDVIAYGIAGHFALLTVMYIIYTYAIGQMNIRIKDWQSYRTSMRGMFNYAMFSLFGSLGTLIAFRIDSIMVSTLIGLEFNGDFGIAATIAQTIAIPTNAIIAISAPVIAAAWVDNDMNKIESVYKKSSINLLIPGLWIYVGMWACLDALLAIMPNGQEMQHIKAIILLLGFSRIIDMATSVNNEIIAYSKYFRFNFIAVVLLAVCNIGFNFYFIGLYGIIGAALATALSLLLYNVAKYIFILIKLKIQPLSSKTVYIFLIALLAYSTVFWWPPIENPFIELFLKVAVLTTIYGFLVWYFKLSEEMNNYLFKITNKIKKRFQ